MESLTERIVEYVRVGAGWLDAAALCGVSRESFDEMLLDVGFRGELEIASRCARVEAELSVRERDPARWLEAVDPKRWNRKASLELTGDIERPVSFIEVRPGGVVDVLGGVEVLGGDVRGLPEAVGG